MATLTSRLVLFLLAITGAIAFEMTGALDSRSINAAGGWPANAFNDNGAVDCPADNTFCFGGNCCPSELSCVGTGDPVNCICCPADQDCTTTFQQNPVCANSEWTLWNATTQGEFGGFFCCLEGQIGDNDGGCWPAGTILAAGKKADDLSNGSGAHNTVTHSTKVVLSKHAIIGIAIGAAVVLILLALLVGCCCWKCCCKKRRNKGPEVYNPTYEPYRQQ